MSINKKMFWQISINKKSSIKNLRNNQVQVLTAKWLLSFWLVWSQQNHYQLFYSFKVSKQPSMAQNKINVNKNFTIIQCQILTQTLILIQCQFLPLSLNLILIKLLWMWSSLSFSFCICILLNKPVDNFSSQFS